MKSEHTLNTSTLISSEIEKEIKKFTEDFISDNESISKFLKNKFSIDITTDQDIISGFDHDWSNINGFADALCRPKDELECAIVIRLCYYLKIPVTISAGRTNLTGSATPEGGIIISISELKKIDKINFKSNEINCYPGVYLEDLRNYVLMKSNNNLIFPVTLQ